MEGRCDGVECHQTQEHFHGGQSTRACLIMKYSAAAREYAKNGFTNMGLWDRNEKELNQAHQHAQEEVVNKLRKNFNLESCDEGAGAPTNWSELFQKNDACLPINRSFICWNSVPGVHLKMIFGCIEKIAFSALNLKVLLEPGQREVARWKMLQLFEFVTGIDKEEVVGENRSTQHHAMVMSDRSEARGRRGRDLLFQSELAALWLEHGVYTSTNSRGRIVISKLGVYRVLQRGP